MLAKKLFDILKINKDSLNKDRSRTCWKEESQKVVLHVKFPASLWSNKLIYRT